MEDIIQKIFQLKPDVKVSLYNHKRMNRSFVHSNISNFFCFNLIASKEDNV
jgi:hypothetical protein